MKLFSCYEKRLHSPFLPLHRQNKEVWVSGLNPHTANVPNRKVPKVRILLLPHIGSLAQLDQSTTLRTSVSGVRVSRVTTLEVWQSWSIAPVLKTGRRQRLKGLNPLASANLPYRITVVRQILDLQVVVRFHLGQHQ